MHKQILDASNIGHMLTACTASCKGVIISSITLYVSLFLKFSYFLFISKVSFCIISSCIGWDDDDTWISTKGQHSPWHEDDNDNDNDEWVWFLWWRNWMKKDDHVHTPLHSLVINLMTIFFSKFVLGIMSLTIHMHSQYLSLYVRFEAQPTPLCHNIFFSLLSFCVLELIHM